MSESASEDIGERERVEYLSVLLLVLALIAVIATLYTLLVITDEPRLSPIVLVPASVLAVTATALMHSRYMKVGEALGLLTMVGVMFGLIITNPRPSQLFIVVFPVFYISLYLRPQLTFLFSGIGIVTALLGFIILIEEGRSNEALLALTLVLGACVSIYVQTRLMYRSRQAVYQQNLRLAETEARFRGAIDGSPDAFFLMEPVFGPDGGMVDALILEVNSKAADLIRRPKEEIVSKHLRELYPNIENHRLFQQSINMPPEVNAFTLEYQSRAGLTYSVQVVRINNLRAISIMDVTEARMNAQIQRELEHLGMQLTKEREMNDLRATMMSTISHEFRTPLTVIMNNAEILDRYYQRLTDKQREERILGIKDHVVQLRTMLENISLIVRGTSNRLPFQPEEADLGLYMHTLYTQISESANGTHTLQYETSGDLKHTLVDLTLLHQIITNLLNNAIKFTPDNGTVKLRIEGQPDTIVFTVSDSGIGIPTEDLARIYEPFHRGDNIGEIRGTGLGLSIVRECTMRHGGTLEVSSAVGEGTTFTVRIPRRSVASPVTESDVS